MAVTIVRGDNFKTDRWEQVYGNTGKNWIKAVNDGSTTQYVTSISLYMAVIKSGYDSPMYTTANGAPVYITLTDTTSNIVSTRETISNTVTTTERPEYIYCNPATVQHTWTFNTPVPVAAGGTVEFRVDCTVDSGYSTTRAFIVWEYSSTYPMTCAYNNGIYTVAFNANGGSGSMSNQSFTVGVAQQLSANAFSRTGYTYLGWATSSGGGVVYSNQQSVTNIASAGQTLTLYAVWQIITYTISYNANGGSGSMSNGTKNYGANYTIASNGFSAPTGKYFNIWNTQAGWTGTNYSPGATYSTNANLALYAQWSGNSYTITYKANGGSGSDQTQTVTYGSTWTTKNNVFSRTGYTMDGWATSAGGAKVYSLNTAQSAYSTAGGTTLYAHWVANTFTYTYYNDGSNVGSSSFTYDSTATLKTASTLGISKSGYTFAGWSTADLGVTRDYSDGATVTNTLTSGNRNVFAVWQRTSTFYSGKSKATTKTSTEYYNNGASSLAIPAAPTAISGWTALGWRYDTTANTNQVSTTGTISNIYGKTWYAVYSRSLTVSYTNGGGTGTAPSSSTGTQYYNSNDSVSTFTFTLPANTFTRTGYTFTGWGLGNAGTDYSWAPAVTGSATTSTAAQWSINSYTASFNANGGSSTPPSITSNYNTSITLPDAINKTSTALSSYTVTFNANGHTLPSSALTSKTAARRTNYSFNAWGKGSASGTPYNAGSNYTITEDVVFYAKWDEIPETDPIILPAPSNPRGWDDGSWLFKGWSASSTATTPISGSTYTPTGNVILYAVWEGDYVTWALDAMGGLINGNSTVSGTELKNTQITLPNVNSSNTPIRNGYKFIGWFDGSILYNPGAKVTLDTSKTFNAQWFEYFNWTDDDISNIASGKLITNATASKWNEFQTKVKNYVNSNFVVTNVSSGANMTPAKFISAASYLNISLTTQTAGQIIYAADFNNLKNALNDKATLLGGTNGE